MRLTMGELSVDSRAASAGRLGRPYVRSCFPRLFSARFPSRPAHARIQARFQITFRCFRRGHNIYAYLSWAFGVQLTAYDVRPLKAM